MSCLLEIPNPVQVLRECHRILRRNGIVSLCEIVVDPDYPRRQTERRWAQNAGFNLEKEFGNFFRTNLTSKRPKTNIWVWRLKFNPKLKALKLQIIL